MENRWPYLLVFALFMAAFPGPLMSLWDHLTKHRITPEEAVRMGYGEEAALTRTGAFRTRYDEELGRLAASNSDVVCGDVSTPDGRFAVAVMMPRRRRTDRDPIVYSPRTPKGFNTGNTSNPLPGAELLRRCAAAGQGSGISRAM